ncbi:MAG: hypothetical protein AABX70_09135 [Nanoarchaeota archaeon]
METIILPKAKFQAMKEELELQKKEIKTLKNSKLYMHLLKRLLECKKNIREKGAYTREDLGF